MIATILAGLGQLFAPIIRELGGLFIERAAGPSVESVTESSAVLPTLRPGRTNAELLAELGIVDSTPTQPRSPIDGR